MFALNTSDNYLILVLTNLTTNSTNHEARDLNLPRASMNVGLVVLNVGLVLLKVGLVLLQRLLLLWLRLLGTTAPPCVIRAPVHNVTTYNLHKVRMKSHSLITYIVYSNVLVTSTRDVRTYMQVVEEESAFR